MTNRNEAVYYRRQRVLGVVLGVLALITVLIVGINLATLIFTALGGYMAYELFTTDEMILVDRYYITKMFEKEEDEYEE